ncbi:MAG: sulfite oxidase [Candidatus Bathyarchaeia archaeon]|jgi:DMSO/TMAO reductase YedYZ molybdopterin-dependent catalytic subunit
MAKDFAKLRLRRFFVGGLFGGILATVILFFATEFLGFPFPPLAIFQVLIAPVPGSIQSVVVDTFREYAKYSAFVASSAIYAIMYGLIAVGLAFVFRGDLHAKVKEATLVGVLVPTVIGLGLQLELANAFPAISSLYGWVLAGILVVAVNLIYAKTVINYTTIPPAAVTVKQPPMAAVSSVRRVLLKKAVVAAAVLVFAGVAAKIALSVLSNQPVVTSGTSVPINPNAGQTTITANSSSGVADIFSDPRISDLVASEVSDNRVFYRVDINPIPPQLDFDTWTLNLHGKVNNAQTLDKNSLLQLATVDEYATLECVSNTIYPPGGLISNAKWTGVPLATLLKQAGLLADSKYVVFTCADGYTVGIPIERALEPGALLAYKMNDVMLPNEHGFPLRAIVPGIYGMMNAKWITEIEVTDQVYLGYWQVRGWSNDARIKTTSIIYYPTSNVQLNSSTPIAGVAFAGDRGISKVEVSVDGGNTWNEATLKPPGSPYSWVLWAYEWKPTVTGTANIVVRATDGTGQLQDATVTQSFPNGASGYPSVQVTVA